MQKFYAWIMAAAALAFAGSAAGFMAPAPRAGSAEGAPAPAASVLPSGTEAASVYLPLLRVPTPGAAPTDTAEPQLTPTATVFPTATPGATAATTTAPTATTAPTSTPTPVAQAWWRPSPELPIAWHWQLGEDFVYPRDVIPNVTVYDIDGELTSAATVAQLHALGPDIKVICYFDAGVYEAYRSDAGAFPPEVIGNPDVGWEDSYWLDIRQIDILRPLMENRIKNWCKAKGFDAIEPDETEVWSNDSGFPITKAQNNAYNRMIAELGHQYGLSVGLKGNTTEAGELVGYFDWMLNEQCWEFAECDLIYASFIQNGKAAFNIEYSATPDCEQANRWRINSARRDLDLVGPTNPGYVFAPCIPYNKDRWE